MDRFLDWSVALGMLKLDEPKSASQKFVEIARSYVRHYDYLNFLAELEKANLKIVEK